MKTVCLASFATLALFAEAMLASRADASTSGLAHASCAIPHQDAAVSELLDDVPTIAQEQGISGTSTVQVRLTATGKLAAASLVESSGDRQLDTAALRIARVSRYEAEQQECQGIGGSYLLPIEIDGDESQR
jgi:TonB family protein